MLGALLRSPLRADVTWRNLDPVRFLDQTGGGARSDAGVSVTPDRAISVSTVYRGIMVLANTIASLPLFVHKRLEDDGKERAPEHPSYAKLHDSPNTWMTSPAWRRLLVKQRILYGNHYSEIVPAGTSFNLEPLDPRVTRVVGQLADGRKKFETRDVLPDGRYGPVRTLLQDEVFHSMNELTDERGLAGIGLLTIARNAIGLAIAAEQHGSSFMRKGARFAGILKAKGRQDKETREANEAAWQRAYGGTGASGGTPLLTGDLDWQAITSNNKEAQWLELRVFEVEDILRFLGVPGVLCNYADKTSTYASAEQFFLSHVVYGIGPLTHDIAAELNKSVVTGTPEFFAEFELKGLLKGDIAARYSAHQIAVMSGFMTRNEIRVVEGLNKLDGLDEVLDPVAVAQRPEKEDKDTNPPRRPSPDEDDDDSDEQAARFGVIARKAVERLVRKEVAAIAGSPGKLGAAKRFADDSTGWLSWLGTFYTEHGTRIAADLGLTAEQADGYATAQVKRLGSGIPQDFESSSVAAMLALLET